MDDIWAGICGTLWPYWWRGPWPGPPPWWRVLAGFIGGIAGWAVFGETIGAGGGVMAVTAIGIIAGNFLAVLVDAGIGAMRGARVDTNRTPGV